MKFSKRLLSAVCLLTISLSGNAFAEESEEVVVDPELMAELINLDRSERFDRSEAMVDHSVEVGEDEIEFEIDHWEGDQPMRRLSEREPMPVEEKRGANEVVRAPASQPAPLLKSGFKVVRRQCDIQSKTTGTGKSVGKIKKGKKVWTDVVSNSWLKVYRKSGHGFISADCLATRTSQFRKKYK